MDQLLHISKRVEVTFWKVLVFGEEDASGNNGNRAALSLLVRNTHVQILWVRHSLGAPKDVLPPAKGPRTTDGASAHGRKRPANDESDLVSITVLPSRPSPTRGGGASLPASEIHSAACTDLSLRRHNSRAPSSAAPAAPSALWKRNPLHRSKNASFFPLSEGLEPSLTSGLRSGPWGTLGGPWGGLWGAREGLTLGLNRRRERFLSLDRSLLGTLFAASAIRS